MKTFACGSVVPGCTAHFEGDSDDAILAQVAEHARTDHGLETVPPELVSQVREHITTA
jgi:predicted small metal-binding protein